MKRKHFHIPLYWLSFLILFFLILSVTPLMAGFFVAFVTNGESGRDAFIRFRPYFPSLIFFLSSLSLSIILALALWAKILVPLGNISQAARRVASGDFSAQVAPSRALREIRDLADNFNRMVHDLSSIESLRNDFVTNISHEFKTPLAAIEGYATLLQDPSLSEKDRAEYTRIIIDSTRQLSTMAGNILLLSRLEKQEIVTNQVVFKLDEQIRQALLLLEPLWDKKHLNLDIELPSVKYYGNAEMLLQVWMNLLQNAIKYIPAGGILSVSLSADKNSVAVSISDTGIGMDEETMKRIFEKFYSKSTQTKEKGNGLGLSITKRIIDLMQGSIEVKSQVDEGSCFTVRLPVKPFS